MADLIAAWFSVSPRNRCGSTLLAICSLAVSLACALSAYKCIISIELEMYCSFWGAELQYILLTNCFVYFLGQECSWKCMILILGFSISPFFFLCIKMTAEQYYTLTIFKHINEMNNNKCAYAGAPSLLALYDRQKWIDVAD